MSGTSFGRDYPVNWVSC